jgi:hypothetical protein
MTMRESAAWRNPASFFASPEAVLESREFSPFQKEAILEQWKDHLTRLLIADEEGMFRMDDMARASSGANAEDLRRVSDVIARFVT